MQRLDNKITFKIYPFVIFMLDVIEMLMNKQKAIHLWLKKLTDPI